MYIIFFISLISSVFSSGVYRSSCPSVKAITTFNMTGVGQGMWYEVGRYPYELESDTSCVAFSTSSIDDGFVAVPVGVPKYSKAYVHVEAKLIPNNSGSTLMNFTLTSGDEKTSVSIPLVYVIYERDGYILHYSCLENAVEGLHQEFAWILSRNPILSSDDKKELNNIIESFEFLDVDKYIMIDQSNCDNN